MWHSKDLCVTKKESELKEEPSTSQIPISQNYVIVKRCTPDGVQHPWEHWDEDMSKFKVLKVKMELCRVCLNQGTIPIHGNNLREDLSDAIINFGGIDISIFDSYPKYLCESCHALLNGAILFRKTAKCSAQLLNKSVVQELASDDNISNTVVEVHKIRPIVQIESGKLFNMPKSPKPKIDDHLRARDDSVTEINGIQEPHVSKTYNLVTKRKPDSRKFASTKSQSAEENSRMPTLLVKQIDLICKQCNIKFNSVQQYRNHKLKTRKHKKKMCTVCKITNAVLFTEKYDQINQKMLSMYVCDLCYKNTKTSTELVRETAQSSDQLFYKSAISVQDPKIDMINDSIDFVVEPEPEISYSRHYSLDISNEVPNILTPQVCLKITEDTDNLFKKPTPDPAINDCNNKSPAVDEVTSTYMNKFDPKCDQCNLQFNSVQEYEEHKQHDKNHKKKMCIACRKTYAVWYTMKYNPANKTTETIDLCDICFGNLDKVLNEPEINKEHKAAKEQKVVFTCNHCDIEFHKLQDYREHRLCTRRHKKKMCVACNKSYAAKYIKNSSVNIDTEGLYVCHTCYRKELKQLVIDQTADNDNSNKVPSSFMVNKLKLRCKLCKLLLSTYEEHRLHMLSHRRKRKICPICKQSYRETFYKKHLRSHKEGTAFVCDVCGKLIANHGNFSRHRSTHFQKGLPYKCSLCSYRTQLKASLTIHMRSHTGERPYLCEECPKKFVTKSNLIKHRRIHKKECDFKCECGKGCRTKKELEMHVKVEHAGIKEHICQICGKGYGYRKSLMCHQLRVHKREKLRSGKQPLYLKIEFAGNQ